MTLSPIDQILKDHGYLQLSSAKDDHQWVMGSSMVLHAPSEGVMVIFSMKGQQSLVIERMPDPAAFESLLQMYISKIAEE